jgi:hypothetical protein
MPPADVPCAPTAHVQRAARTWCTSNVRRAQDGDHPLAVPARRNGTPPQTYSVLQVSAYSLHCVRCAHVRYAHECGYGYIGVAGWRASMLFCMLQVWDRECGDMTNGLGSGSGSVRDLWTGNMLPDVREAWYATMRALNVAPPALPSVPSRGAGVGESEGDDE